MKNIIYNRRVLVLVLIALFSIFIFTVLLKRKSNKEIVFYQIGEISLRVADPNKIYSYLKTNHLLDKIWKQWGDDFLYTKISIVWLKGENKTSWFVKNYAKVDYSITSIDLILKKNTNNTFSLYYSYNLKTRLMLFDSIKDAVNFTVSKQNVECLKKVSGFYVIPEGDNIP